MKQSPALPLDIAVSFMEAKLDALSGVYSELLLFVEGLDPAADLAPEILSGIVNFSREPDSFFEARREGGAADTVAVRFEPTQRLRDLLTACRASNRDRLAGRLDCAHGIASPRWPEPRP